MDTHEALTQERFSDPRFMIVNTGNELTLEDLHNLIESSGRVDDGHGERAVIAFMGSTVEDVLSDGSKVKEYLRGLANMGGLDISIEVHTSEKSPEDPWYKGDRTIELGNVDASARELTLHVYTKEFFDSTPDVDKKDTVASLAREILSS